MPAHRKLFLGEHLHRIIVVEEPQGSVEAKAQAVHLFEDGVVVQWMFPGPNPNWAYEIGADEHRPDLGLRDDLGTHYEDALSGSSGGDGSFRGETAFVPAVPDAATELEILGLAYPMRISLGQE